MNEWDNLHIKQFGLKKWVSSLSEKNLRDQRNYGLYMLHFQLHLHIIISLNFVIQVDSYLSYTRQVKPNKTVMREQKKIKSILMNLLHDVLCTLKILYLPL